MTALKKDWWKDAARDGRDLEKIRGGSSRARLTPLPDVTERVPPFRGLSRQSLLTLAETCARLDICMTTLRSLMKRRMIFAHGRSRSVRIPIEECENYAEREFLLRVEKNA